MYNNIGNKVKGLAIFVFVIGTIGSLVSAIVMWATDNIAAGFGVLIGGCLSAWVGSWVVYCIGDTNVKTTELTKQVMDLQDDVDGLMTKDSPAPIGKTGQKRMPDDRKQSGERQPAPTEDSATGMSNDPEAKTASTASDTEKTQAYALPAGNDREKCSKCGTIQNARRSVCWNCGAKFIRNAEED